ncbi:MAG: sigma-70 family RNA polymerase sigma factor [Alphaproteobacteria bacterium]|nr:sigma-70 family RNA polymerase sigma factor [Alphaproteobacteria bacterium]
MDEKRRKFEMQALPHLDAAYNFARWLTRSPVEAEDIVQEAMLRAFRSFDGFRGTDVKPWLLTIVRNCFITSHDRKPDLPVSEADGADPAFTDAAPDPEAVAISADHVRKLNLLVATIPGEFREVLILREMEDLSYRDIARITGTPIGTVMSRLARARAMLKEAWLDRVEGARNAVQ